jgi:hypothetical protein
MSRQQSLYEWMGTVGTHFPHLSKPQAVVLALWSLGMVLARSCALSAVALVLALFLGRKRNTLRQRLREWYREAPAKKGSHRQELDGITCFAPLVRWILQGWSSARLALALDATTLGTRFVVLALSAVYRGCAIPVAWKVLSAQRPHPWKEEWLALLKQFQDVVPRGWTVIVLADRGLYARWLFQAIAHLGWHPLLRIKAGGTFRPAGWYHFSPLTFLVPLPGESLARAGDGVCHPGSATGVYLVGLLGERACGGLARADRLASTEQRRLLVGVARVDRAGLQAQQAGGLAMAADPHGRSRPCASAVVGGGRSQVVVSAGRRGRGGVAAGGNPPRGWGGAGDGVPGGDATEPALAAGECLSLGVDGGADCLDPTATAPPGLVCSRAVAGNG